MRQFDVKTNTELLDVVRQFFGDAVPEIIMTEENGNYRISCDNKSIDIDTSVIDCSAVPTARRYDRLTKIALYDALTAFTGRKMPWGALTGVRPTKLVYECINGGKSLTEAEKIMTDVYRVEPFRAKLLSDIIKAQDKKVFFPEECVNLYIHIPFCSSRCIYCSFMSVPIEKFGAAAEAYVGLLIDEINRTVEFLYSRGKKILSVYIGGGTPTALPEKLLEDLLTGIDKFDCEYTCEAGRPDTITEGKLDILKKVGVNRVCVNPQTLSDDTLVKIGRRHTVEQFYNAYELVKSKGFIVNCDLIAGLEEETLGDFIKSFDGIKSLMPENFTVHSLSKKNGSVIRYNDSVNTAAADMLDYCLHNLEAYRPYYLYRQKRQAGNLENVGFSLNGFECVNNITTMEETVSVMSCGAGAISKFIHGGVISRFAAMRDIKLYIERYKEKLNEKLAAFDAAYSL
ncbi:MAG: coproporphyrinogen dehydrogenase HemZ [Clostridiales bacterium]|nr:coproporphyrinogen dehydrogenase HemZ [Clostridiales bacterium]